MFSVMRQHIPHAARHAHREMAESGLEISLQRCRAGIENEDRILFREHALDQFLTVDVG